MSAKSKETREVESLSDLTVEERNSMEEMFEDGYYPAEVARRLDLPAIVVRNAQRSWQRVKELHEQRTNSRKPVDEEEDPLDMVDQMIEKRLRREIMREQLDDMREESRHRREMNRLEEEQKDISLRERALSLHDDEPMVQQPMPIGGYDFERDPIGSALTFAERRGALNNMQKKKPADAKKPLTDDQIDDYFFRQSKDVQAQALAAVGTAGEPALRAIIRRNEPAITKENLDRICARLLVLKGETHGNSQDNTRRSSAARNVVQHSGESVLSTAGRKAAKRRTVADVPRSET